MIIDSEQYLEFIEELIRQARANVLTYENFHGNNLADIRSLDPMDSFLYGVASGKLDQLNYIRDMVKARMEQMND